MHSVAVLQPGEGAIDIRVVDLACSRLVPTGNVGHVHQSDHVDILLDLLDQVSLGDLFVKQVVEKLHARMIHGAHNLDRFGGGLQIVLRVFFGVDAFKQQSHGLVVDLTPFDDLGGALEGLDRALVLLLAREAGHNVAR